MRRHVSTIITNRCVKSLQSSFISLQTTGLSSNELKWCWGHSGEKQRVSSCKGVKYPWGVVEMNSLWQPKSCPSPKLLGYIIISPQPTRLDHGYKYVRQLYKWFITANAAWTKILSGKTTPITVFVVSTKYPQGAICSSCNSMCIYNLLQCKSSGNQSRKIKTMSRDTMVIV